MAQGPFSSTGSFFVHDREGNAYPATFLTDANGTPTVDEVLEHGLLDKAYSPERSLCSTRMASPSQTRITKRTRRRDRFIRRCSAASPCLRGLRPGRNRMMMMTTRSEPPYKSALTRPCKSVYSVN